MHTPVRKVLAENLKTLMRRTISLDTQAKVARKAGIAQTSVSNMLRPETGAMASPKLDSVEKVARAFGIAAWQLLLDSRAIGSGLSDLLMRPASQDDERRLVRLDDHRKTSVR